MIDNSVRSIIYSHMPSVVLINQQLQTVLYMCINRPLYTSTANISDNYNHESIIGNVKYTNYIYF